MAEQNWDELEWHKACYGHGDCPEVADNRQGGIALRESSIPDVVISSFCKCQFAALVESARNGDLDELLGLEPYVADGR